MTIWVPELTTMLLGIGVLQCFTVPMEVGKEMNSQTRSSPNQLFFSVLKLLTSFYSFRLRFFSTIFCFSKILFRVPLFFY